MSEVIYREATNNECKILSQLAYESEAYWQYSQEFMDIFKEKYSITAERLQLYRPRVLEVEEKIIGFWGGEKRNKKLELEYFYIAAEYIGKGYGKLLWQDLLSWCNMQGILEIELVTSNQAVPFYEKQGATVIGRVNSEIDGRPIPLLRYRMKEGE